MTVFEVPGVEGLNPPTVFSTPPTHGQIMYRGVSYILYIYDLHHNFVRSPTFEKFNPRPIFHNSNTVIQYVSEYMNILLLTYLLSYLLVRAASVLNRIVVCTCFGRDGRVSCRHWAPTSVYLGR